MANKFFIPKPTKAFWLTIISSAVITLVFVFILLYFGLTNLFFCIFIIPFTAGFMTILLATSQQKKDIFSRIMLPWATLLIIMLIPIFWKLRFLMFITFPIASIGGLVAYHLLSKFKKNTQP